jgi:peptidyl-prolyl cis-trans isomerase SurA
LKYLNWAALGLAISLAPMSAEAQRLDGIAAIVNDEVVLQSDVEEQLALLFMNSQIPQDSATVDTLRRQVLNQLIDEKLIVAEAKRQGITVSEAEVSRQVEQAIADAKERMGGEQGFRQQLARENLSEEKLREKYRGELERQTIAQRLVQKQLPKKTVTASEAEAYFTANKDKFPHMPSEIRLQVIQIPASADTATDAAARSQALAVRKRILTGEKFAKVAADVSDDPGSARSGGDLGFFSRGMMEPAVENTAFRLKLGELSQPVRSAFGWHIVEPLERDTVKTRAGKDSTDKKGAPVLEVHARHILIRVPISEADAERSRKLAERVRGEAVKGTDFGTLVRRYSKYEGQQGEGGDLGFVSMASLQPNIRAGLDTLEVGEISEVLVNPVGFNIFKVVDRKPEREYQLEEIRKDLPDLVAQMKQRERYGEWVKTLRAKAHIEIRNS